jgi:hypothetical protein
LVVVEEGPLRRLARGVSNHPGGTAGEHDDVVTGVLESTEHQETHEIADMEAVSGGVKAHIGPDRPLGET